MKITRELQLQIQETLSLPVPVDPKRSKTHQCPDSQKKEKNEEAMMTSLSANQKREEFMHSARPWFIGIAAFLVISVVLVWLLARLASWVFAVLNAAK